MSLLNAGIEYEWNGKTYRARDLTEGERELFATWLKNRAESDVARLLENPDVPEEYVRLKASVVEADIAAGMYDWGSETCVKAVTRTRSGMAYALYLMHKDEHPEIDELVARQMWDARAKKIARLIAEGALDPPDSAGRAASSPPGPPSTPGSPTNPATSDRGKSRGSRRGR